MIKEQLLKEIRKLNIKEKPIAIQIPEGLKQYSVDILNNFKKNNPILFVDPCYGACDTKDKDAKNLGCKLLVHFGHYPMNSQVIKTKFIPISYKLNKTQINYIVKEIKKLNLNKINLVTTIQYLSNIEEIKTLLKKEKIEVIDSKKTKRVNKHMVLGCDASTITNKKNAIVFIGDGVFHANNLAFIYNKQKIYTINPISKHTQEINISDKFIKKRYAAVAIASKAKSFGILVSTKQGQQRLKMAKDIKKRLEKNNKKVYILVSDYIKQEYLEGVKVDCYINTACPRITYDDGTIAFKKPVLSVTEVDLILDLNKDIKIDEIK